MEEGTIEYNCTLNGKKMENTIVGDDGNLYTTGTEGSGSFGSLCTDGYCSAITFDCGKGKSLVLTISDGKIEMTGDGDMNEAAKTFFNYFLQGIIDEYIKGKE